MKDQEINRYWKQIVNTMNEGLMLIEPNGTIIMVNQSFERLTGYTSDEVVGRPCTLLDCDACERTLTKDETAWCKLFKKGRNIKCRCHVVKKDGSYLPAIKNAAVLKDEDGLPIGAVETLTDLTQLDRLDKEITQLFSKMDTEEGFYGIIGKSSVIQKVIEVITKAAQSDAPVIIYGESGTGKELVAHAIHHLGHRKDGPFVQFNCAALNEALLESELFGHIKGAFTGAYRHRIGRFEAANCGDIFLDEIGDVPLSIQVKLLRVLESKQFERVGDHKPISVDVRIITATNKNIEDLIAKKTFREDLFFRINVIPIHIPPLRKRSEDIPLLVNTFIHRLRSRTGKNIIGLTKIAMDYFLSYAWPGNIRELMSTLEYAFVVAEEGLIGLDQLPPQIIGNAELSDNNFLTANHGDAAEKNALIEALRKSRGNQSQAARILGVCRVTVWNRIKKYQINLSSVLRNDIIK